jgi:hypothetical protein
MIQRCEQCATLGKRAQAIKTDGVEALEDVPLLTMLRGAAMLRGESLNFLESGDDSFFLRRASALLLWRGKLGQLGC